MRNYLSKLKFFDEIFDSFKNNQDSIVDVCCALRLEHYPVHSLVFEQNEVRCDRAYIVLSGEV